MSFIAKIFSREFCQRWTWLDFCLIALLLVMLLLFFRETLYSENTLFGTDRFSQADIFAKFGIEYFKKHWQFPKWNPYIFSGMPFLASFSLSLGPYDVIMMPFQFLNEDAPYSMYLVVHLFWAGLFSYILLKDMGLSWYSCFLGAALVSFDNFLVSRIYPGHGGKICVAAYLPLAIFFLRRALLRDKIIYYVLFGFVVGLQYLSKHPQILFYCLITYFLYFLYEAGLRAKKHDAWHRFVKQGLLCGMGLFIALLVAAAQLWPNYEYKEKTMRGSIVDKGADYKWQFATSWSLPPEEVMGLWLRNPFGWDKDRDQVDTASHKVFYRGRMGLRQALEYVGVLPLFLAIVGLFGAFSEVLVPKKKPKPKPSTEPKSASPKKKKKKKAPPDKKQKAAAHKKEPPLTSRLWQGFLDSLYHPQGRYVVFFWFIGLLTLSMAVGKYFIVYPLFYYLLPGFSMFRVPLMTFVITSFCFAILPAFGLHWLTEKTRFDTKKFVKKAVLIAAIVLGISIIITGLLWISQDGLSKTLAGSPFIQSLVGMNFNAQNQVALKMYLSGNRSAFQDQRSLDLLDNYLNDVRQRFRHFLVSWWIFIGLLAVSTGLVAAFSLKVTPELKLALIALIIIVSVGDLWSLDNDFVIAVKKQDYAENYKPIRAVPFLLNDPDMFRIFSHRVERYPNEYMVHDIQSISGYHAAPLESYFNLLRSGFSPTTTITNWLDVKYLVLPNTEEYQFWKLDQAKRYLERYRLVKEDPIYLIYQNTANLSRVFFPAKVEKAPDHETMKRALLNPDYDPAKFVFTDTMADNFTGLSAPVEQYKAEITDYQPDTFTIQCDVPSAAFMAVSEIYYPGWKATIDGQSAEVAKVNGFIRGLELPAGKHEVVFSFEPISHILGKWLTVLTLILIAGGAFGYYLYGVATEKDVW